MDGMVDFGNLGRLDHHSRSALATRHWVDGRRALPWNLGAETKRRIQRLGLAERGRHGERGYACSFLTPEGIALGEILRRRGTQPLDVPIRPCDVYTDHDLARLSDGPGQD